MALSHPKCQLAGTITKSVNSSYGVTEQAAQWLVEVSGNDGKSYPRFRCLPSLHDGDPTPDDVDPFGSPGFRFVLAYLFYAFQVPKNDYKFRGDLDVFSDQSKIDELLLTRCVL